MMRHVKMLAHILFWLMMGVLIHDYAHALYTIGGYKEILSLQGGWVALAIMIILWLSSSQTSTIFATRDKGIFKEFSKGSLAVIGVVVSNIAIELLKQNITPIPVLLLGLGFGFLVIFAYLVYLQVQT